MTNILKLISKRLQQR